MKQTVTTEKLPVKLWLDDLEEGALAQARNLANLPFAFKWIAVMPDAHQGYGMPIGGVMAARGAVVPNAVGVDIGCGMCAVRTSLQGVERDVLKNIMRAIRERVPLGFNHHKEKMRWEGFDRAPDVAVIQRELDAAQYQLGTLGGGNHFIEVQRGSDGHVWIMIHSGSRNFGLKIANEYNDRAKRLCAKRYPQIVKQDLAFLPMDSDDARNYLSAMNFALAFAKENRFRMIGAIQRSFLMHIPEVRFEDPVNIHHNYAVIENHFGRNVWVHRKGATSAKAGETGIIPGSMGTPSYIVAGLGNPESFMSCSHGAGRVMGRQEACRSLSKDDCDKAMQGIIFDGWKRAQGKFGRGKPKGDLFDLEEAPLAYKNIEDVIAAQLDLVRTLVKLRPLGVIKG